MVFVFLFETFSWMAEGNEIIPGDILGSEICPGVLKNNFFCFKSRKIAEGAAGSRLRVFALTENNLHEGRICRRVGKFTCIVWRAEGSEKMQT